MTYQSILKMKLSRPLVLASHSTDNRRHGNNAAARNISTSINASIMIVEQSILSWMVGFNRIQCWRLCVAAYSRLAEYFVPVQIIPSNPVRILVSLEGENFSQGDKTLLTVLC